MSRRVVAIGECMVEVAPAEVEGLHQISFAGDTFNTSWYLKRLQPSWEVDFATRVGHDDASERMVRFFEGSGLGTGHIQRSDDRTVGLYMITLDDGERSFSYWRGQSAARELADDTAALKASFAGADLAYFSGITLGILDEAGRASLFGALTEARKAGTKIAFDSNLRPKLWASDAEMCAAVMEAAGLSDVILPSHDDEATFFGDADPKATLSRYLTAGACTIVVKNGGGAILFSHEGVEGEVAPDPVTEIVDTTAAGDSFNAGFFSGLLAADGIEDAIYAGCHLAGKVIAGRGALVETD